MKSLMLSLLLVALSSVGAARAQTGEGKNDLERAGLAGRVKSVEAGRVEYTIKDGRGVERRIPARKTAYDERGNRAEEILYGAGGAPSARHVYTYDAAGRNTGYEEYHSAFDKSLTKARRHVYTLDGAGRRVEYTVYESNGSIGSRFTYGYDAAGNQTEEAFYSWQGKLIGRIVYAYDAGGRLLSQTSYNEGGEVGWKIVNVYDAEGRKAEAAQYQGETLRYRFFHKYDAKGRMKEVETREFNAVPGVHVTHSPEPGRVVYTYDDEKKTKEVATYDGRGALKRRMLYSLDEKGNDAGATELNADGTVMTREIRFEKNGVLHTVRGTPTAEYVHDAQGNWTLKTFLIKPAGGERAEPYWAEFREIVYY